MARLLATLAVVAAAATTVAAASHPIVTAFFPQVVGEDLQASVVAVNGDKTTLAMCMEGTCDELVWTFAYGPSTAAIQLTASRETLTIGCDVTMTKDRAACSLSNIYSGTTSTDTVTLDHLTDFVTTFTITAGATLLNDVPTSTKTRAATVSSTHDHDDHDDNDDDDRKSASSASSSFSLALPTSSRAVPASTARTTLPTATSTGDVAAGSADGGSAAASLTRSIGAVGGGLVAAAIAAMLL